MININEVALKKIFLLKPFHITKPWKRFYCINIATIAPDSPGNSTAALSTACLDFKEQITKSFAEGMMICVNWNFSRHVGLLENP